MKRKVACSLSLKLWSPRTSSSRQFVGWDGAATKKFPFPGVGAGNIAKSGRAPLSIGTWFPGNCAFETGSIGQSVPGQTSEKLPERSAADGTGTLKLIPGTTSLRHSSEKKKKLLLLSLL